MRAFWVSLLLFLSFSVTEGRAMSYPDSILFKDYPVQYMYRFALLSRIYEGRTSEQAKVFADSLYTWARQKDDVKLAYGFRILSDYIATDRRIGDTAFYEKEFKQLINELDENGLADLKAEAVQSLASCYWQQERFPEALEYCINAYKIYRDFKLKSFPQKPQYLLDFGGRYYHFRDYSTAVHYMLEGYRCNPAIDSSYIFTMLNSISLCYLHTDRLDSAEYYMKKVYDLAVRKGSQQWVGIVSGNMGALYFKLGEPDKALAAFNVELEIFNGGGLVNTLSSLAVMSEIYINKGDNKKALELALESYEMLRKIKGYTKKFELSRRIYSGLAKAYAANGQPELAYIYLDSSIVAKDSVDKKANAQVLAGIRHKISANERLAEQEAYNREKQNNTLLRNVLMATIALVVIVAILIYNRQRLKHKFSQRQLESQKKHVESELETATLQLNALVGSISERNDLIETFTAELARLREHLSDDKLSNAEGILSQIQKTTIITDDEWEHFAQMFEKVNSGFLKRLNSKVKGLSPIETKFIMLSKLKLSTKEVAAALGISAESVRLNRKRLYDKLGLAEGEHSLNALIESI